MHSIAPESNGEADPSRVTERAALARLSSMGGDELVQELATIFLEDMPTRLLSMRDGLVRRDPIVLSKAAHSMKSSSAQLGAERLANACDRVESAADRRDFMTAEHWIVTVEREYGDFAAWLARRAGTRVPSGYEPDDRPADVRPTIAVVEDNADNRLLVDAMLGDRFELQEYTNGVDALLGMRERKPDLVLLDVSLPGMDGVEVVSRIRRDALLAGVPVVALTAHAMAGDRERYLAAGFDGYVAKPIVEERDLTDTVDRLLTDGRRCADDIVPRGPSSP